MPPPSANKAVCSGLETQRRRHQKSQTGVSVALQKGLLSYKKVFKKPNDILESFLCHSLYFQTNLTYVDLSENIIKDIYSYKLSCLKNIRHLVLKYNMIRRLRKYAFADLYVLRMLDSSGKKIELLKFCAFCDLNYLQFLNLYK